MLTFWKINAESKSEWIDNDDDLSTFVVVIAVAQNTVMAPAF